MNLTFSKIIYVIGGFCSLLFIFHNDSLQRKIIRDGAYDYTVYVAIDKNIKTSNLKTYFWYRSGKVQSTVGGIGGAVLHKGFSKYYRNKQLVEQGTFYFGLKDGTWKSWYDNGTIEKKITYRKGIAHGSYYTYDTIGNIKTKGHYSNGEKSGTWIIYSTINDTVRYKKGKVFIKKERDSLKPTVLKRAFLWVKQKIGKKKDSLKIKESPDEILKEKPKEKRQKLSQERKHPF